MNAQRSLVDLPPDKVSNETAGEHFTPREVIRLMVGLLFIEDDDALRVRKRTNGLAFGRMNARLPMGGRPARELPATAEPSEPERRDHRDSHSLPRRVGFDATCQRSGL